MNFKPLFFLLISIVFLIQSIDFYAQEKSNKAEEIYQRAFSLKNSNPDSSVVLFEKSYSLYLQSKDTLNAIQALFQEGFVFETSAKYAKSYDVLWKALLLMDNIENNGVKSVIYHRLGRVYSYYKREDKAIEFLTKALGLQKKMLDSRGLKNKARLVSYYYSIAATYRELNKPDLAKKYLDSSYLYYRAKESLTPKSYLDFEKAILLTKEHKEKEALKIMEDIYPWFNTNTPSYMVLVYKYWGDAYKSLGDVDKSEKYYLKALKVSEEYKSHIDFTPLVYEKLSDVFLLKNNYQKAFKNLKKAKELDRIFFDSRSKENQSLLEIKDDYRLEKERQEKIIKEQYLKHLEQEDQIIKLQRIILIGSLIFLLVLGFFFFKHLRAKHHAEKELIRKTKELEIEKTKELLSLKNKELATSALQLIEKDEFLKELKTRVREGGDKVKIHEINKVLRSVSVNNNKNWDDFKMRFIDVNKEFYDVIFAKFPKLSQGDQKICALIKLNFSSKDMARLLGISVESVHTVRHRIRKKMSLERNVNLEEYINSL
ncbi:tetratricopeptide repeat protein [Polaribacter sp. Z014]|uniref:tetratricopeptide repeat protein n=1 Tax=Polaribacter sp. Z014 TaxID=2927126 RepID=UPI002020E818|nr:tetratricopeptide repeat protein [Polaribacter sp. Z014]MCL7764951.1 tetratricopeptide repeat protein [Polaribacter sp. Z014]